MVAGPRPVRSISWSLVVTTHPEAGGNNKFASTLHWGPAWDANGYEQTTEQYTHDESLADDFHIYGLLWTKDRITTYIDTPDNVVLDVEDRKSVV